MEFPSRSKEKDCLIAELIREYIEKYQTTPEEKLLNERYKLLYSKTEKKVKAKCRDELAQFDAVASFEKKGEDMVMLAKKGKENEAKAALEKLNQCRALYVGPFMHVNELNSFSQSVFGKELNLCLDECDAKGGNYQQCYRQCFNNGFKFTHKAIVDNMSHSIDEALNNFHKL